MNKIWVILKREYLTRVKNRLFIIMTLLGPLLIVLFYGGIILVATRDGSDKQVKQILYKANAEFFKGKIDSIQNFRFTNTALNKEDALKKVSSGAFDGYMEIADYNLQNLDSVQWISKNTLSVVQTESISEWLSGKVYHQKLQNLGIRKGQIDSLKPKAHISTVEIDDKGSLKNSSNLAKSGVGMFLAFIVYMFIFIYGSMIMRSTLEEKTNRIVEVVISSVKPFQLMMGKILGVALVGLTQFAAWVIISFGLITVLSVAIGAKLASGAQHMPKGMPSSTAGMPALAQGGGDMLEAFTNLPFGQIIFVFFIFFVGGFLLYSSMFAAIGAAANQETDTQQFMLPISLPLIFGFVIAQTAVFQDPNGPTAKLFSYIPFTSPVLMVVRSPFGIPWSQVLISALILLFTFVFFVWMTGRIYRVGILMYGKKPSWRQLGKWIFRKN
jgi:ABC-2 type transport system permease protein